ncbi:MAG: YicC/YloC family endoribonuclease [Bacteroidota bacterium]
MLQSMTGYGSSVKTSQNYKVTIELKSLNSKYLELVMKLPKVYVKYEHKLRNILSKKLGRGKVLVLLNIEILNPDKQPIKINRALLKGYLGEFKDVAKDLGIDQEISLEFLLGLPEVIPTESENEDPEEWELIEKAVREAIEGMIESRMEEGKSLSADLNERVAAIRSELETIKGLAPKRMEIIRDRLGRSLEEIRNKVKDLDKNRFEQELIFYMEKQDINEEIVRLTQHLNFFEEMQALNKSNGKKLQFISQEMGREINTIGSKANNADLQRHVVRMKDELEKIKEQVLNAV